MVYLFIVKANKMKFYGTLFDFLCYSSLNVSSMHF
jgi:hypothetical protein